MAVNAFCCIGHHILGGMYTAHVVPDCALEVHSVLVASGGTHVMPVS